MRTIAVSDKANAALISVQFRRPESNYALKNKIEDWKI